MLPVVRPAVAALAVLLALTLAACGGSSGTETAKGETRTFTNADGSSVTLPAKPTRVLPLSEPTLDATLALGVTPVATTTGRGQNAIPAYLKTRAKGVKSVGNLGAPNLEQVAELAPDVILLDGTAFQDAAVVDKLEQIAPVVNVSKDGTAWRASFEKTADALGRSEEGAEVLAKYDARVAETKTALAAKGNGGASVSIVRWSGIGLPAVFTKELCAGRVLTDLGVERPTFQDQIGPGHSVPVSLEEIEKLDADWIFFGALGAGSAEAGSVDMPADAASSETAIRTAEDTPGFTRLKAVRAGHVVPVDGSAWTSAGGVLAADVVLGDVARTLGS